MDTREKVFSQLEKDANGPSGVVIIPNVLMGNVSLGEIRHYLEVKGYNVVVDTDSEEVYFHYESKEGLVNA